MRRTGLELGGASAAGALGLILILAGIERMTRIDADAARRGIDATLPASVLALFAVGVLALNLAVFGALSIWARHLRTRPETRQIPSWALGLSVLVAGGLGLSGQVRQASHLGSIEVVPQGVDWGFVAIQTLLGIVAIAGLVGLGVKWTPGRSRRKPR